MSICSRDESNPCNTSKNILDLYISYFLLRKSLKKTQQWYISSLATVHCDISQAPGLHYFVERIQKELNFIFHILRRYYICKNTKMKTRTGFWHIYQVTDQNIFKGVSSVQEKA